MKTSKTYRKKFTVMIITLVIILCATAFLCGCENSSDKAKPPAAIEVGKADFAQVVKETDRMLSGDERDGKPGETQHETVLTETTTSLVSEGISESGLAGHELNFFFPNRLEEDNFLEILGKDICDSKMVAIRRKESDGLVSCATWKARLKKAKTMLKMDISKYENGGKAWDAINRMSSTGGFITGDVVLTGDEEWPDNQEGQIEARSFIKSYYGRIRPTYVYRDELGKPEDYLLDNERQLEALKAGR